MEKRILFVDDDQSLLVLYRRHFSRLGYDVLAAHDPEQALQMFARERPHAVVMDVKLTGENDGIDLLQQMLALRRVPVIINTAYASFRQSFLSWAADAYILKSSDLTELRDALERHLATQVVEKSSVAVPSLRASSLAVPSSTGPSLTVPSLTGPSLKGHLQGVPEPT